MFGKPALSTLVFVSHRMTWFGSSGTELSLLRDLENCAEDVAATGVVFVGGETIMGLIELPHQHVSFVDLKLRALRDHRMAWCQRGLASHRFISRQLPIGVILQDELPARWADVPRDPARFQRGNGHSAVVIASALLDAARRKYPSYMLETDLSVVASELTPTMQACAG